MSVCYRYSIPLGALTLSLLLSIDTTAAQWTQTLGWGGAGYGKRGGLDSVIDSGIGDAQESRSFGWLESQSGKRLTDVLLSASQASTDFCQPNPMFQKLINNLVQNEISRIQKCREDQSKVMNDNSFH